MLSPGASDRWLWLMTLVKRKTSIKKRETQTNAIHGANNATVCLPVLNADPQAARSGCTFKKRCVSSKRTNWFWDTPLSCPPHSLSHIAAPLRRRVDQASLGCVSEPLVLFPRFYLDEKSMSTNMLTRV